MMVFFGYWQLGNRQIFFNKTPYVSFSSDAYNPKHYVFDYRNGMNYTLMFLLFFLTMAFFPRFVNILGKIGIRCGYF